MKPEIQTRIAIIDILTEVLEQKRSLTHVLPNYLLTFKDPRDRALIQYCSYGILREYLRLNAIIKKLVPRAIKEQKAYYLILIGIYQLMSSRMPPFAIVHSTVDTAKKLKLFSTSGLINGVLRAFQRQYPLSNTTVIPAIAGTHLKNDIANKMDPRFRGDDDSALEDDSTAEIKWLHPQWLLEKLQKSFPDQWQAICAANNEHPPMWLRINTQRITPKAYLALLNKNNIKIKSIQDEAVCLESPVDILDLPGFEDGFVSVQDAAAQLAANLLDLQPHQRILDACAAPGGKTCHILEKEKTLNVIALDKDETRITKILENLNRLRLNTTVKRGDALKPDSWWDGKLFDRILLDAPCSAIGVIRRHPDIKILRQPEDIPALAQQQLDLLHSLWPLLKPQGILVYATCSFLPEENENVLQQFCDMQKDATLTFTQRILPGEQDRDGFFYAIVQKTDQQHSS